MACFCFRTSSVFHILIYYNTMCVVRARLVVPSCSCYWSFVAGLDVGARCWSGLCLGSSSYWFGARSFTHPKVGFFLTPLSFSKFYIFGLSNFGLSNLYLTSFKFYIWSFKLVFQIWFLKFIFGFSSFFLGISGRYCYEGVCHRHRSNAFSWAVFWIALS